MNITATQSPYQTLSAIVGRLRGNVGGWGIRGLLNQALMFLLYRRLFVICSKMERLVLRFEAGRLVSRADVVRVAAKVSDAAEGVACTRGNQVWPRRFGWLVRLAGYQAMAYGSQLRAVLETPEMVALLVAAPQAVAILRPLCRMLMVETRVLRPLAVEPGACEEVRKIVRRRAPRVAIDWGRIPLPRGILAVARRQGVRKA